MLHFEFDLEFVERVGMLGDKFVDAVLVLGAQVGELLLVLYAV